MQDGKIKEEIILVMLNARWNRSRRARSKTSWRPDLEMVALDYFLRLGHDHHRRLSKLYAWEKKSKTSWGAETVDYEKWVSGFVLAHPELNWRLPYKQ